ncbi:MULTISPECIES: hypothetical protein [Pectobacterium]|uniref:Uncharacterized protein n=1 Tax=Pectobacterium versatile TaxID=2488639 RepID=A0ABU8K6Q1_9GAMM|nr:MULTISPECIES: hypothetical protein [Pectobacterium]MBN3239851.1 hypothetical protein [Pectobacterium versatile]MCA6924811.1 hypothetical protein [Pectobacterium versatile]MCH5081575.1 hypothetical protein [Pectobacterium versatile]MCL6316305.1 hypothetical protein [Pectobacterium atrosepticum]MCL6319459.1 hypothetical protein [Pectobacterium atrosepticum]
MTTSKRYEPVKKITVNEEGKTLKESYEIFDHDAGHFVLGEDHDEFTEAKSRANTLENEHLENLKLKSTPKRPRP